MCENIQAAPEVLSNEASDTQGCDTVDPNAATSEGTCRPPSNEQQHASRHDERTHENGKQLARPNYPTSLPELDRVGTSRRPATTLGDAGGAHIHSISWRTMLLHATTSTDRPETNANAQVRSRVASSQASADGSRESDESHN